MVFFAIIKRTLKSIKMLRSQMLLCSSLSSEYNESALFSGVFFFFVFLVPWKSGIFFFLELSKIIQSIQSVLWKIKCENIWKHDLLLRRTFEVIRIFSKTIVHKDPRYTIHKLFSLKSILLPKIGLTNRPWQNPYRTYNLLSLVVSGWNLDAAYTNTK